MATVRKRLDADLKDAMRAKNETTTTVVRAIKSAIKYKEVEPGATGPLDEPAILQVIGTLIKQRRDSVEQFTAGYVSTIARRASSPRSTGARSK